jgi:hypothetical protein
MLPSADNIGVQLVKIRHALSPDFFMMPSLGQFDQATKEEIKMVWIVGLLMAFVFIKLGMLIIMVKFLAVALQLALLALAVLGIIYVWRKVLGAKPDPQVVWHSKQINSKGE